MENFEDPVFKTKYLKNKRRVKHWEYDFMEKYGRKPNKNDMKEADVTIKEAYKVYWKLKTRVLEETLADITFCDDIQSNVTNNSPQKSGNGQRCDKNLSLESATRDIENVIPHNDKCFSETKDESFGHSNTTNIEGVWGDHLSKNKEQVPKKRQRLLIGKSSFIQLSKNKFDSSTFIKRNPKKSLSFTKIKNKSENNLNNSSIEQGGNVDVINPSFDMVERIVTFEENKSVSYSINTVQQLVNNRVTGVNRNLNQGWIDRCARDNNVEVQMSKLQRLSHINDSELESMESSIHSLKDSTITTHSTSSLRISDSEDYISNSDSEEERRNQRFRKFKMRFNDRNTCSAAKRPRVEIDSDFVTARPNSGNDILQSTVNTSFNPAFVSRVIKMDNTDTLNDTLCNVNTDFNLSIKSVNPENDKVVTGIDIVKPNVTVCNNTVEINHRTQTDEAKIRSNTVDIALHSAPLTNRINFLVSNGKPIERRIDTLRSKGKQPSFEDSEFDSAEETHDKMFVAKARKRIAGRRTVKRCTGKGKTKKGQRGEETLDGRIRKKRSNSDKSNEERNTDSETEQIDTYEYGVEMLQTVPRVAINSIGASDLIERFSESVATDASVREEDTSISSKTKTKPIKSDKEKLKEKIVAGTINNNFIRINLKKKVYVRGKKNFNLSKYKKNQWKQRKTELASSESRLEALDWLDKKGMTCFKCRESGHLAKYCTAISKSDALLPLEDIDESSNILTLKEAERMANENTAVFHDRKMDCSSSEDLLEEEAMAKLFNDEFADSSESASVYGHKIPRDLISRLLPPQVQIVDPMYPVNDDGSLIETPTEVFEALRMFGHENFRVGQEKAVMRILSGQSTLVALSTGSGKSLCYQLPAYLYSQRFRCIVLVISPLVSLMDDQVTGVPDFLSVMCLHTGLSSKTRERAIQSVKDGKVNVLLVSPEAIVAGETSTGFGAVLRQLPPIAFACIDEAHCISQWSHNFRPSYLMICRVLKEKLGVRTVLGLTATATQATVESIAKHLDLHDGTTGVILDVPIPRNLILTVSKDENKDRALITLLKSERFHDCDSVIVYCTRREECERIAGMLRISLQDSLNHKKLDGKLSATAETYHAGMVAYKRKRVQKEFMNGRIRIVVATIAFGMGVNKSNIRAVIHYNMPGTFEEYVQEIGRAGRDGLASQCHLFLHPTGSDKWELRKHIYAKGIDRYTIRHLLQKIFIPCSCAKINEKNSSQRCPGHEVALPIDETVKALDITEETISTLLCYLELHPKRFITVLSSVYTRARVSSYKASQTLKQTAQSCPPLAMAIALDTQKGISNDNSNVIEFSVIDVASAIGWDSGVVKSHLKDLEWTTGVNGKRKRSGLSVRYDQLGLRVKAPGDFSDAELDEALNALIEFIYSQESSYLRQLEIISSTLDRIGVTSIEHCLASNDDSIAKRSEELKNIMREYFRSDSPLNDITISPQDETVNEQEIAADTRNLITCYKDTKFTGRTVARIFQGIQSPNYPAIIWGRCRFWKIHLAANFNSICKIATKEILALRQ